MTKYFEKVIHPGRGRDGEIFCAIKFADGRLSLTGVEGPLPNGNARGGCGQITIDPSELNLATGWTSSMVKRFCKVWTEWHLNDMRAGCEHQRTAGWAKRRINTFKPRGTYGKHFPGQRSDSWNMLVWVTRAEHPKGLLSEPCEVCGYKYGSAWLREDVPAEVLDFLTSLPDTDVTPAWV